MWKVSIPTPLDRELSADESAHRRDTLVLLVVLALVTKLGYELLHTS